MVRPICSILISSKDRERLFRRTLWSIANRPPSVPFEVIVADDGSTDDILGLLQGQPFPWKFIRVDSSGLHPYWNCPALTNNVAFVHSSGKYVFQMGNEIIAWGTVFDQLLDELPKTRLAWTVSTTYDLPQEILEQLDDTSLLLTQEMVDSCRGRLLSNENNVPNYLSVFTRAVWEELDGYDERYLAGIGAEDSDFMRRAFTLPGFTVHRSDAVSLHQYHGGVSHLYRPLPQVISERRLAEGVAINRRLFQSWDGTHHNRQSWPWPPGRHGVREVIISASAF